MANNVTKEYIRATCNAQLVQYARDIASECGGVTSGNSSADYLLARATGVPLYPYPIHQSSYWHINADSVRSLSLYRTDLYGPEIEASMKELMLVLSRVRRVYFTKTRTDNLSGNASRSYSGTWVNPYFRYGYAYTGVLDGSHYRPGNYQAHFGNLATGINITQAAWDSLLANMRSILASNFNLHTYNVSYCHYSCHSSCHYSRGRR